jgi:metallo-beta-lactamase family protein
MGQSITFLGAAETVTGSKHLLNLNGKHVFVDCGLFQGGRELRERNWKPLPIAPSDIDAIVITHAHMDHIGYLPKLVREGYQGPIYATRATVELARISLPDSGRIQEEDARQANKHGSRHKPALPLYNEKDAYAAMKRFEPLHYREFHDLPGGATWQYLPAGHILGSAFAEIFFENGERILMSGDLGRFNMPIIRDPEMCEFAEYLTIESTYGDRLHSNEDPLAQLEGIVKQAAETGGAILVPSFSIGRTQELLFYLSQLQHAGRMPRMPIFVDSPMATSTTHLYATITEEHDSEMLEAVKATNSPLEPDLLTFVRDREQSKALNSQRGPMVIIAGSGMANGGRILHHLLHRLSNPTTIVCFTGYQATGTLGRSILEGADEVRIYGQEVQVQARVEKLNALSAHADQGEMLHWLRGFKSPPRRTFIVHGEPPAQAALQLKIREELGWETVIPKQGERFEL